MLHHVLLEVSDLERSAAFYDAMLAPLGWRRHFEEDETVGWGIAKPVFFIAAHHEPRAGFGLLSFSALGIVAVKAAWEGGMSAGGTSVADPGERTDVAELHPDVAELDGGKDGFHLFDLTRLDRDGYTVPGGREAQIGAAHEIALIEAERCVAWFRSKPADAVVSAIQARATQVAEAEAAQAARIPGLDDRQRAAVEQAIRRTVRKVVHTPTVRAKEACVRGDEHLLQAARWLFGIDGREEELPNEPGHATHAEGAAR